MSSATDRPRLRLLLAALIAVFATQPAGAEDTRPAELPYEQTGPVPQLDSNYRRADHRVVIIKDADLLPKEITLEPGQLVAWISYARASSTVVFEREVAKSMICHSLVNFSIKEDELRSADIMPGEFASFCQLKPGRYRYKVVRDSQAAGALGTTTRIDGWINVKEVEGADG